MSDPDLSDDSNEPPKPKREFIFYKERSLLYRLDGPLWFILHAWLVTYIDIREDGELEHFVPLRRNGEQVWIDCERKKLVFEHKDGTFHRPKYPVDHTLDFYNNSRGLSEKEITKAEATYFDNTLNLPIPQFQELLLQHVTAPFFVFQMVCGLLWLFDDYWYYSLMTIVLLIMLEIMTINRRIRDMSETRSIKPPIYELAVLREGRWTFIPSSKLLPGDIVCVTTNNPVVPADMVILAGSSAVVNESMLTGESTPNLKEAIISTSDIKLDCRGAHKSNILFSGTRLVVTNPPNAAESGILKKAPYKRGAVCYVLRTGFDTVQGKLVRTILYSSERVTGDPWAGGFLYKGLGLGTNTREATTFLLDLIAVALVASVYVAYYRLVVEPSLTPSKWKLFLSLTHIITNVVPPEFPVTMSIAVTMCLGHLMRNNVYCTEPFRLPFAGQVDVCCFDKTGTITNGEMTLQATKMLPGASTVDSGKLLDLVLSCCHTLTAVDPMATVLVGDPLEQAMFTAARTATNAAAIYLPGSGPPTFQIFGTQKYTQMARFPFNSELQRMSVVMKHENGPASELLVLSKGSPEMMETLLKEVPQDYEETYQDLAGEGLRVIAAAYKRVSNHSDTSDREEIEKNLHFVAFIAFRNEVKTGTIKAVKHLKEMGRKVPLCMITGDHPSTSCEVAQSVGLKSTESDGVLLLSDDASEWRPLFDSEDYSVSLDWGFEHSDEYTLCVQGKSVGALLEKPDIDLTKITVFSRMSPVHKEDVIKRMVADGRVTLMCGDGTNDVGALKAAHVGISLLSSDSGPVSRKRKQQLRDADLHGPPIAKIGMDASVAAPFTYRGEYIKCVPFVLRCGRAVHSVVMTMYKILALNSLLGAFSLSVLTLHGAKFGDFQSAVEGIAVSLIFTAMGRSKPESRLSQFKPVTSIFHWSVQLSLGLQLVTHVVLLLAGWKLAVSYTSEESVDLESAFEPTLLNSQMFIQTAACHFSAFLANYEGPPSMKPMKANRPLWMGLIVAVSTIIFVASEASPDFNELLSIVRFPDNEGYHRWSMFLVICHFLLPVCAGRWCMHVEKSAQGYQQRWLL
ncbi:cation-transporting ATPase 13a1, putative [Perkinsus marinus ATCC 50983]|uniref:Cation-transporting ATPase 13a1, putative n=1 Tax=Perkinsus marinus (strain ATCC 50983 / TXsc) TaxID=423536 RepID=C5LVB7_PERM5|nr:cation-transporting ATPase 13a1, putative [Perkinsus marinus ATCC 50983]EEQ99355.1 cation-transporting ATPase 13a1, putative [Perkinsus marinus ATCC 50983]|eukprot:XP_002766638.1 cation-transporting ATPase 13a1, putative [Perkinsus marinus ATCC 50983]